MRLVADREVDPRLVVLFNHAADAGRANLTRDALAGYEEIVARASGAEPLAVSPAFFATTVLQASYCLMDLHRFEDAVARLGTTAAYVGALAPSVAFSYHQALGNSLGRLGRLDASFAELVRAISIAEDLDDYVERPGQCWAAILGHGVRAEDWNFLRQKASIALQNARLRGNVALEAQALGCLETAKVELAKANVASKVASLSPADWVLAHLDSTAPTGKEDTLDSVMRGVFATHQLELSVRSGRGMFAGLIVTGDDYVETVRRLLSRIEDEWRGWESIVRARFGEEQLYRVAVLRNIEEPAYAWVLDRLGDEWMAQPEEPRAMQCALEVKTSPEVLTGVYPLRFTAEVQVSKPFQINTRVEVDALCARLRAIAARRGKTNLGLAIKSSAHVADELHATWGFLKRILGEMRGYGVRVTLETTMGRPRGVSCRIEADRLDWIPIAIDTESLQPGMTDEVRAWATAVAAELGVPLETTLHDDR